jgi:hypothetical protein
MQLREVVLEWFRESPAARPHIHPSGTENGAFHLLGPTPLPLLASVCQFSDALMRYIRFLKSPRVVTVKGSSKQEISCLITITSDLGDSFLPCDIQLSAELLSSHLTDKVLVWRTVQWSAHMRTLPVTFPLVKNRTPSKFRVRIGAEPKSTYDEYNKLSEDGICGVVSAWSSQFDGFITTGEAEKLVERRFELASGTLVSIYEETGESIARHLWYYNVFPLSSNKH